MYPSADVVRAVSENLLFGPEGSSINPAAALDSDPYGVMQNETERLFAEELSIDERHDLMLQIRRVCGDEANVVVGELADLVAQSMALGIRPEIGVIRAVARPFKLRRVENPAM